ncbi:hypothetical protein KGP95_00090 [Burkholderia multivorans]|uniref:hypothetical protein n=1 Tax=Burkholderia multivorans TaxID=87883 RepID=UPI00209C8B47|nr:hypothetical protein [Burkholderia multivorans]MCO8613338.1 hypothetical protein [Burkholderia multivorans]MCO8635740.1 hypothetical protein [Burkholderia multivorans]
MQIEVSGEGETEVVTAKNVIIATGTRYGETKAAMRAVPAQAAERVKDATHTPL